MKTAYTLIILMMLGFFALANNVMANETVDNVVNGVKEAPTKVVNFVKSEIKETKEFQKKGWADAKKQTAQTLTQIKSLFGVKND
jgi:hypothetical protein